MSAQPEAWGWWREAARRARGHALEAQHAGRREDAAWWLGEADRCEDAATDATVDAAMAAQGVAW